MENKGKKRKFLVILAVFLCMIVGSLCAYGIRSIVGWRPFKNFEYADLHQYSLVMQIDLKEMKREYVQKTNMYHFVKLLNEIRVTPYDGEYDPWSMMYLVYQEDKDPWTYHRIGVTLDPVPIIDIGGNVYRIDRETAEKYQDFWKNHSRAGYFKVGG
ncbi:MAG: hypothetical protein IJZ85_11825 [Lachnospiraceae bacterium]|nr:hypothetical protein [Lachnospiraceae bacterium]